MILRKSVPPGQGSLADTFPDPEAGGGYTRWAGVRPEGQGPYTFGALTKIGRVLSGLGNRAYKAIALDVESGFVTPFARLNVPTALANPTYKVTWLDTDDIRGAKKRQSGR